MLIIPFFLRSSFSSLSAWKLQPIAIFLENRGKNLYKLSNDDTPDEWLRVNGFVKKQSWQEKDLYFVEIDPQQTKLQDFYSFEQLTQHQSKGIEECWKTFFMMTTKEKDDVSLKSWNELFDPEFMPILQSIKSRML